MSNYFSTNLKFIRESKGLSQNKLANLVGVNQTTIARWEMEEIAPSIDNVEELANVLKVELPDILGKDLRLEQNNDSGTKYSNDGVYIQKADGTTVFLKNASGADKALIELPEEQKKAILAMIGKTMDEIDKELDGE